MWWHRLSIRPFCIIMSYKHNIYMCIYIYTHAYIKAIWKISSSIVMNDSDTDVNSVYKRKADNYQLLLLVCSFQPLLLSWSEWLCVFNGIIHCWLFKRRNCCTACLKGERQNYSLKVVCLCLHTGKLTYFSQQWKLQHLLRTYRTDELYHTNPMSDCSGC